MVKRSIHKAASKHTTKQRLTTAQAQVLEFITECIGQTGVAPSYRDIQNHFGYKAIGTVQDHVRALVKKGALEDPKRKKGLRRPARTLLPIGQKVEGVTTVPIYGEVAAGSAREAVQLELGVTMVSQSLSRKPSFALRVVGNSMIDVGIFEGDELIVEREVVVRNGDIVVALVDGETTVKRFFKKEGKILLVPENKEMQPILVTHQRFEIQGKVVGLQRKIN